MTLLKKLALVVSIVFGASLAVAAAVVAAGPGGLGTGTYSFTSKEAGATFGTPKGGPASQQGFSVMVDRGLNSFRPKDPKAPRTVVSDTIVSVVIFDDAGDATFGCFIVNPANFTVSKDLQSARLRTTLTTDEVCPGFGSPVNGANSVTPFAISGGGGLPLPISLDIAWTGMGVTVIGTDRSTTQCLDYSTQFNSSYQSSSANASGTISAIGGSFDTPLADVTSSDVKATIKGTPQPACFPQ
jgi:hypothetical protein